MSKRKRRDDEIVCMCYAYEHPHRLGGGRCTGAGWCQAFRQIDSYECQFCTMQREDNSCDVVSGLERIHMERCNCAADECRTRNMEYEYGYLPLDIENYWDKIYFDYYDDRSAH